MFLHSLQVFHWPWEATMWGYPLLLRIDFNKWLQKPFHYTVFSQVIYNIHSTLAMTTFLSSFLLSFPICHIPLSALHSCTFGNSWIPIKISTKVRRVQTVIPSRGSGRVEGPTQRETCEDMLLLSKQQEVNYCSLAHLFDPSSTWTAAITQLRSDTRIIQDIESL